MKFTTTLVFLLLFLMVGGFFLYFNQRAQQPVAQAPAPVSVPGSLSLPPPDLSILDPADQITWLQIQNKDSNETLTLVREGQDWKIKFPLNYPASQWVVDQMVGTLMTLSKVRVLTPEKEWEEYGLLRPAIKIGIETAIHPGRRYLFLGNESPVGDSVYARWQESDDFFVVDSKLKQTFDRSLYAVREKRVFRISPDSILKIRFRSGSELYELARRKNQWVWIRPRVRRGMTVDPVSSEEFSAQIRDLFIKDFLDPDKEKVDTSFFKVAATVTVWGSSKQKEIFYLGQEAPVRDAFYGKREGEDGLLLVDRSNLRAFFETVRTMGSPVVGV